MTPVRSAQLAAGVCLCVGVVDLAALNLVIGPQLFTPAPPTMLVEQGPAVALGTRSPSPPRPAAKSGQPNDATDVSPEPSTQASQPTVATHTVDASPAPDEPPTPATGDTSPHPSDEPTRTASTVDQSPGNAEPPATPTVANTPKDTSPLVAQNDRVDALPHGQPAAGAALPPKADTARPPSSETNPPSDDQRAEDDSRTVVVHFASNALEGNDLKWVSGLKAALDRRTDETLVLEGHADARGGAEFNKALSIARAKWVKAKLVARGARPSRIRTLGLGKTQPVGLGADEQSMAANRRVEARWEH